MIEPLYSRTLRICKRDIIEKASKRYQGYEQLMKVIVSLVFYGHATVPKSDKLLNRFYRILRTSGMITLFQRITNITYKFYMAKELIEYLPTIIGVYYSYNKEYVARLVQSANVMRTAINNDDFVDEGEFNLVLNELKLAEQAQGKGAIEVVPTNDRTLARILHLKVRKINHILTSVEFIIKTLGIKINYSLLTELLSLIDTHDLNNTHNTLNSAQIIHGLMGQKKPKGELIILMNQYYISEDCTVPSQVVMFLTALSKDIKVRIIDLNSSILLGWHSNTRSIKEYVSLYTSYTITGPCHDNNVPLFLNTLRPKFTRLIQQNKDTVRIIVTFNNQTSYPAWLWNEPFKFEQHNFNTFSNPAETKQSFLKLMGRLEWHNDQDA